MNKLGLDVGQMLHEISQLILKMAYKLTTHCYTTRLYGNKKYFASTRWHFMLEQIRTQKGPTDKATLAYCL